MDSGAEDRKTDYHDDDDDVDETEIQ